MAFITNSHCHFDSTGHFRQEVLDDNRTCGPFWNPCYKNRYRSQVSHLMHSKQSIKFTGIHDVDIPHSDNNKTFLQFQISVATILLMINWCAIGYAAEKLTSEEKLIQFRGKDLNHDGKITYKEVEDFHQAIDKNTDGLVSKEEYTARWKGLVRPQIIKIAFASEDIDDSGTIDFDEERFTFEAFDADRDKVILECEFLDEFTRYVLIDNPPKSYCGLTTATTTK
ncbi:---NA--- [Octopus vulgaris]|uniref:---NA n=1 Tax=Octopus vulgaris TaxID=6645 RepID=A0AA36EWL9_OCTVU|nr:---NA--- [Octopus vulgaris]